MSEKMNLQIPQARKVQIKILNLKSTFFNRKTRKNMLIKIRIRVDFRTNSQHTYIPKLFYLTLQVLQPAKITFMRGIWGGGGGGYICP